MFAPLCQLAWLLGGMHWVTVLQKSVLERTWWVQNGSWNSKLFTKLSVLWLTAVTGGLGWASVCVREFIGDVWVTGQSAMTSICLSVCVCVWWWTVVMWFIVIHHHHRHHHHLYRQTWGGVAGWCSQLLLVARLYTVSESLRSCVL